MSRGQDELERFQNVITESLQQFLSQPPPRDEERTSRLLEALPSVTEKELEKLGHKDSACGICIQPFLAILAEEESANVMESPAFFSGELGVTRLNQPWQCGHLFCSITKWIKTGKLTCPMCRKSLIEPGSEHEPQSWQESDSGIEVHPIYDELATGANADLERFLFSHVDVHRGQQDAQGRDNSDDDSARHEYFGMYS